VSGLDEVLRSMPTGVGPRFGQGPDGVLAASVEEPPLRWSGP